MDSIIKVDAGQERHFIVIPHVQSITISPAETPQIKINFPDKTISISAYDLPEMANVKDSVMEEYVRDCKAYEKLRSDNIQNINEIARSLLDPYLQIEQFRAQKSLLPYRGAKIEINKRFSSFIFNCLNYLWSNFGGEGKKQILSLSIPAVSDADQNIEHIFHSLMRGQKGFDVDSLFRKDFIESILLRSYESCNPVTKPIQSSYKPDMNKCLDASLKFVEELSRRIQNYYAAR
jgi:hypothetical protein